MKTLVWYCKSKKGTGMPIHVKQIHNGHIMSDIYTNKFITKLKPDQYISVVFNNATGQAKRQGATTVLEIHEAYNDNLAKAVIGAKKGTKNVSAMNIVKKKAVKRRKK